MAADRRALWAKGDDDAKRLVQCPACWTAAMATKDTDWECECGELMTLVDLRAARDEKRRRVGWLDKAPAFRGAELDVGPLG